MMRSWESGKAPRCVGVRPARPSPPPPLRRAAYMCCACIQALLERTKLSDICLGDQNIVFLEHNQTIGEALKTLAKHNILSAPMASDAAWLHTAAATGTASHSHR